MKRSAFVFSRTASTATQTTKAVGDISSVFPSLSGKKPEPLPERFSRLKRSIAAGNEHALRASWTRLLDSLSSEVEDVRRKGSDAIPTVSYKALATNSIRPETIREIRRRGSVVIRNVLPRREALDLKAQAQRYISANRPGVKAFPQDDPAVYELYWTPSQTTARAHKNVLQTQCFLQSLWHSSDPGSQISTTYPLTYADRFRIRHPGDSKFALGPHVDGGSLERWEDPEYRSVYRHILAGEWEAYDPFDAKHRINAKMDLYNGAGACSMFRFFQGWLSMSDTGPSEGTLKVCPMLKHATAYLLLRPFFEDPSGRSNMDSSFPGSVQGACQEYNHSTHPDLNLEDTMVSVPQVEPGDFVAWHCDTIHAVDKQHRGADDSSVLYIPATPITGPNTEFLKRQRDAAVRYSPPPDFPGAGGAGELGFEGAVDWSEISKEGLRAMGMGEKGWEIRESMSEGEKEAIWGANRLCFV